MSHFALPRDDEVELLVLGFFANTAWHARDRRANAWGTLGEHPTLGLPQSANDLAPRTRAAHGDDLALSMQIPPGQLAEASIVRDDGAALATVPKDAWTEDEAEAVAALTLRVKRVVHALAFRGCAVTQPPGYHDGEPMALGEDGYTRCFKLTPKGLEEAKRRVRGTRFESRQVSILNAANEETRRTAPEWARSEHRREGS